MIVGENNQCCFIVGENSIVIISGANLELSEDDVSEAEMLIGSAKVVVCQLEIRPNVTLAALRLARKHGGSLSS